MSTLGKLAALSVLLVLAALAVGSSYSAAAETNSATNESITMDLSAPTPVDAAGEAISFQNQTTVYNATGTQLTNETDYVWHPSNGSVSWLDTSRTSDSESATISYTFEAVSQQNQSIAGVLRYGLLGGGLGLLLFGGLSLLDFLGLVPGGR